MAKLVKRNGWRVGPRSWHGFGVYFWVSNTGNLDFSLRALEVVLQRAELSEARLEATLEALHNIENRESFCAGLQGELVTWENIYGQLSDRSLRSALGWPPYVPWDREEWFLLLWRFRLFRPVKAK